MTHFNFLRTLTQIRSYVLPHSQLAITNLSDTEVKVHFIYHNWCRETLNGYSMANITSTSSESDQLIHIDVGTLAVVVIVVVTCCSVIMLLSLCCWQKFSRHTSIRCGRCHQGKPLIFIFILTFLFPRSFNQVQLIFSFSSKLVGLLLFQIASLMTIIKKFI